MAAERFDDRIPLAAHYPLSMSQCVWRGGTFELRVQSEWTAAQAPTRRTLVLRIYSRGPRAGYFPRFVVGTLDELRGLGFETWSGVADWLICQYLADAGHQGALVLPPRERYALAALRLVGESEGEDA